MPEKMHGGGLAGGFAVVGFGNQVAGFTVAFGGETRGGAAFRKVLVVFITATSFLLR
jgi:hypothetical protein